MSGKSKDIRHLEISDEFQKKFFHWYYRNPKEYDSRLYYGKFKYARPAMQFGVLQEFFLENDGILMQVTIQENADKGHYFESDVNGYKGAWGSLDEAREEAFKRAVTVYEIINGQE